MSELSVSKMEHAKALKAVRDVVGDDEKYKQIRNILVPLDQQHEVERAIQGLSEEDEFALMCRLMGTATHLVPLEERPLIPNDAKAPDFLARFQPGCSMLGFTKHQSHGLTCLIEVKSTEKNNIKLSGGQLTRLRNFADTFGQPLFIAVRFLSFDGYAYWVIKEDSDRSLTSIRITVDDINTPTRFVLWDECFLVLDSDIKIGTVFSNTVEDSVLSHPKYGGLSKGS